MPTGTRTEHPHIVVLRTAGGDRALIKGTRLPVSLIAALFNQGETPAGLQSLYPNLTPGSLYDALSYYFDHKTEIDKEIRQDSPEQVLEELRRGGELTEVSPGRFRGKKPFGGGV